MLHLEHPTLVPFEPLLRRVMQDAQTGGLQALAQIGKTVKDLGESASIHRRFLRGVHYGFDLAQGRVAAAVIDLDQRSRQAAADRTSDPRERTRLVRVLNHRQLVLRRLIDSILFQMLMPETRALRYFSLENQMRPIDPIVLKRTVAIAHRRNQSDRLKFNVVCDLTTVAHIGDLVEVDRPARGGSSWKVIELKEGRINELLSSAIEEKQGTLSEEDLGRLRTQLGRPAEQQAKRMLRQRSRQEEFRKILDKDRGVSPQLNLTVDVLPEKEYLSSYTDAIREICEHAKTRSVAMTSIDGCLRLLALKSDPQRLPRKEEDPASLYTFYHIGEGIKECVLGNPEGARKELAAMGEIPPVIDLVDHNMLDSIAFPIFLFGDDGLIFDLILGRLRLFAQFDMRRFFDMIRAEGLIPSWESRKKSEEYKRVSEIIPGSPGSRGIRVEIPGLAAGIPEQVLLSGFFRRLMGEFTPPGELLRMIKKYPEQMQQAQAAGRFSPPDQQPA